MLTRALVVPALLLAAAVSLPRETRGQDINGGFVTDELVVNSLAKGVEYLLNARNPDGHWEAGTRFVGDIHPIYGGETCLALYALLHVGEMGEDPRLAARSKELAPTVKFVINLRADSVYSASMQASCLSLMPKEMPGVKEAMLRARNYLVSSTLKGGGHYYSIANSQKQPGHFDHSNSNYALLGLAALADSGVAGTDVPPVYWQTYEAFWRRGQNKDGGWGYAPGRDRPESTPTMSAAGVASLLLCRQFTQTDVSAAPKEDKALVAGLAKIGRDYDPTSENLYYLYTLERIGLANGMKYINTQNWYKEGAAILLRKQETNGSWNMSDKFHSVEMTPNVFTAYSLLFLARGRSPLMFNKLEYEGAWDARPRDDANVTGFIARAFEKPLAWQSVSLKPHEDWLDAPVLLITGNRDPKFTDDQFAMIKNYIRSGGIVFSTADANSADFTAAMRKYAARAADDRHEMRELEADHPLFTLWAKVEKPPKLQGMSNGVRELWIHSPTDLGAVWQRNKHRDFKAPFEVAANLCYYVSGRSSPSGHRLDTLAVPEYKEEPVRTVKVARVQYGGNWDPEPGAWPRMAKLARQFKTTLELSTVTGDKLNAAATPLAHLTGTAAIVLDEAAQKGLKKFVDDGGTLLIDACGGTKAFSDSIKSHLEKLFEGQALEPIPADNPLFAAGDGGGIADSLKIETVEWRRYTRVRDGSVAEDKPRLLGIRKGERLAVIVSQDDLTSGLLGTNVWGVAGYMPRTAQAIVRNVVLYAGNK